MPKVSVIMGTYNGESTLDAAIQSICDQTFTDWEFIICDDCSTDRTWELISQWEKKDPRIKGIRNSKNMKIAASSNRCIALAKGSYIAKMDDDDVSYPERLEKEVRFLDEHLEFDFVSSLVDCYDGEKIVKNYIDRKPEPQKEDFLAGMQFVNPEIMKRKRKYRYRVDEALVRYEGFKALGLLPKGFPYVIRPLVVGLIPQRMIWYLKYKNE